MLLVSVPLTHETTHLLAKDEFEILGRNNAFIINISRGKVLEQGDLIESLKKYSESGGTGGATAGADGLRGAALDVTDPEPLPDGHPLWTTKNCFVTPHIAGATEYYAERCVELLDINIQRWKSGEKVLNPVNLGKGY